MFKDGSTHINAEHHGQEEFCCYHSTGNDFCSCHTKAKAYAKDGFCGLSRDNCKKCTGKDQWCSAQGDQADGSITTKTLIMKEDASSVQEAIGNSPSSRHGLFEMFALGALSCQ